MRRLLPLLLLLPACDDGGSSSTPSDSEVQSDVPVDAEVPPPDEGAPPPDDGASPPDEGAPPPDEGMPDEGTLDEGMPPPDEGMPPPDQGMLDPFTCALTAPREGAEVSEGGQVPFTGTVSRAAASVQGAIVADGEEPGWVDLEEGVDPLHWAGEVVAPAPAEGQRAVMRARAANEDWVDCDGGGAVTVLPAVNLPAPGAGELLVTEVMYDPHDPLGDQEAEWLELWSTADGPRSLATCRLHIGGSDQDLGGGSVEAGQYLLIARSEDMDANGGIDPDIRLGPRLANEGEVLEIRCDGEVVDHFDYGDDLPLLRRRAIQRDPADGRWCPAEEAYYGEGDATHYGTPGAENPACPPPDFGFDECFVAQPLEIEAGVGTTLVLAARGLNLGVTDRTDGIDAQPGDLVEFGYGPQGTPPGDAAWRWREAAPIAGWDADAEGVAGYDGYAYELLVPEPGDYAFAFRFSADEGEHRRLCDGDGGEFTIDAAGRLTSVDGPCAGQPCVEPPEPVCQDEVARRLSMAPVVCEEDGDAARCVWTEVEDDCSGRGGACVDGLCLGEVPAAGPGEVLFTEVMYSLGDADWFELTFVGDQARTLHGCRLEDTSNVLPLQDVLLEVGDILLVGVSDDPEVNGGLDFDLVFPFSVGSDDSLALRCPDGLVDRIEWVPGFPDANDSAISLRPERLLDPPAMAGANQDPGAWCVAPAEYVEGRRGSPGQANPECDACIPDPCHTPPVDACDGDQVVRYAAGTCDAGMCEYPPEVEACPEGRTCAEGVCVLPGHTPPAVGDIVITELMPDPHFDLADGDAEWFELYNRTEQRVDLNGCIVGDAGGNVSTLMGVVVPPLAHIIIARSADPGLNGGLRPAGTYDFRLGNEGDVLFLSCGGREIDRVDYSVGFPLVRAASIQVDPASADAERNDDPRGWCTSRGPYYVDGDGDNLGSPGSPNGPCESPIDRCVIEAAPAEVAPYAALQLWGRVGLAGITDRSAGVDPHPRLFAQLGFGAEADPETWSWREAAPDGMWNDMDFPGDDRYGVSVGLPAGDFHYGARFSADGGFSWTVCAADEPLAVQGDACAGEGCAPPQPGELRVVEVMYAPRYDLRDADAEWIELRNGSSRALTLDGCVVDDGDPLTAVDLTGTTVEPGELLLLGRSNDPALNGGIEPDLLFTFGLGDGGDTFEVRCADRVVDRLKYDDGGALPRARGASLSQDPDGAWCVGSSPYYEDPAGADRNNLGTPGALNPACP